MARKSEPDQMAELKTAAELRLRHLYVMVLKEKNSKVFGKNNQPTFLRNYLCDSFLSKFYPIKDSPATKAANILNKLIDDSNGPSKSEYRNFYDLVRGKTKPGEEKDFSVLHQQSEHLERKLATQKDKFQRNLEIVRSEIGQSFIEILSEKAPWLQKSMDGLHPIPLLEADFYKLLTVATVISLNLDTYTGQDKTEDDVDKLCYYFLFDNAVPEVLPDFSLKNIFDGIFGDSRRGAVPGQTPKGEPILKDKEDLTDLDRIRIMLSGIPGNYSLIPTDESGAYASATQILENTADEHEINNLCGFFGHYSKVDNLKKLWDSLSKAIEQHMVAFEQADRNYRKEDEEILRIIASVSPEESKACLSGLVNALKKAAFKLPCEVFSIFLSGHCIEEMIDKGKNADCITAFVLIAVCCLKTKPGGSNASIPKKREQFKNALIQKIKAVFFADIQTHIQQADEDLQQLITKIKNKGIEDVLSEGLAELTELLGTVRQFTELLNGMALENQKIPAEYKNLLIDCALSMINANTRVEESDRDKAKSRLLEPGSNSPIGGK